MGDCVVATQLSKDASKADPLVDEQTTQDAKLTVSDGASEADKVTIEPDAKPYGPLTLSEEEKLQREANEDTTRSEDLRLFLKEMHEKLKEDQQQQQQQQLTQVTNPSASQYSLMGHHPSSVAQPTYDLEQGDFGQNKPQRFSTAYSVNPANGKPSNQTFRTSLNDLTSPENPPDGGWGWIVVFGSFCCMILVDGICLSYGLLLNPQCVYNDFKVIVPAASSSSPANAYGVSGRERRATTLRPTMGSCIPISDLGEAMGTQNRALLLTPGSFLLGVYLLLGPLVSALTNQFDFRPVAMTGAAMTTLALFLSSFANSIEVLIATFGLLGGVGFALIYLPAIATVGHWFQRRRPLAVGLALCGSGVGCLLGAQAVPRLVDWVTWRGALIIMAATSFQCLSLIVLFRPMEVHIRISQVQRAKRDSREAFRRAAASRRADAERVLLEIRQRKRLAAIKAVQTVEYQRQLQLQHHRASAYATAQNTARVSRLAPPTSHSNNPRGDLKLIDAAGRRVTSHGQTMLVRPGGALTFGPRNGRGTILTTKTGPGGGRVLQLNPMAGGHLPGGRQMELVRTGGANSVGWLRNRAQSGRDAQRKRVPSRRVVIYRGSIMQRIIEEKRRQRTISVGSLDGMVITRDNELIAAPPGSISDRPLLNAAAVNRISEAVARKIDLKFQQQQQPNVTDGAGGAGQNVTVAGSRCGLSRSQLRASLPQVVQEYIQSQLSLSLQQQQQQHKQSLGFLPPLSGAAIPVIPTMGTQTIMGHTRPVSDPPAGAGSPTRLTSTQGAHIHTTAPASFVVEPSAVGIHFGHSTPVTPSPLVGGTTAPPPLISASALLLSSSNQVPADATGTVVGGMVAGATPLLTQTRASVPNANPSSNCPSECVSLRRTISDASIESRLLSGANHSTTGRVAAVQLTAAHVAELLDDEIKADIHARLRRELARPQYKKDLFYTGSVRQLGCSSHVIHHQIQQPFDVTNTAVGCQNSGGVCFTRAPVTGSVGGLGGTGKYHSIACPPSALMHPCNTARLQLALGLRASSQLGPLPNDLTGQDVHNSQTNVSMTTSIGAGASTFIPPAPCPTIQPHQYSTTVPPHLVATAAFTQPESMIESQQQQARGGGLTGSIDPTTAGEDAGLFLVGSHASSCYYRQPRLRTERVVGDTDSTTNAVPARTARDADTELGDDDADGTGEIDDADDDDDGVMMMDDEEDDDDDVIDLDDVDDEDDEVEEDDDDDGFDGSACHRHCCRPMQFCMSSAVGSLLDRFAPMQSFINELLSPWILVSWTFLFMLLSSTATMMGHVIPFLLLPDLLAELNWTASDSRFAISAIGVGNTVGRLIATWSSTYRWADCLWLNNGSLFATAICVLLMPLVRTFYTPFILICIVFGLLSAVFVSLKSILVVELLGLDRLTNSFGYMLIFQGIAAIVGPPVAGHLRELRLAQFLPQDIFLCHLAPVHHAASAGFYFSAACLFLACLLACPLRWLSRRESASGLLVLVTNANATTTDQHPSTISNPYEVVVPLDASHAGDTMDYQSYILPEQHQHQQQLTQQTMLSSAAYMTGPNASLLSPDDMREFGNLNDSTAVTSALPPTFPGSSVLSALMEPVVTLAVLPPSAMVGMGTCTAVPLTTPSTTQSCTVVADVSGQAPPCMLPRIDEVSTSMLPPTDDSLDMTLHASSSQVMTTDAGLSPVGMLATSMGQSEDGTTIFEGFDGTPIITMGTLVLPGSGIAGVPVAVSSTGPTTMTGTAGTTVEVVNVQEEPGLEPVAEEEEDEFEYSDDEPVGSHTGAAMSSSTLPLSNRSDSTVDGEVPAPTPGSLCRPDDETVTDSMESTVGPKQRRKRKRTSQPSTADHQTPPQDLGTVEPVVDHPLSSDQKPETPSETSTTLN